MSGNLVAYIQVEPEHDDDDGKPVCKADAAEFKSRHASVKEKIKQITSCFSMDAGEIDTDMSPSFVLWHACSYVNVM